MLARHGRAQLAKGNAARFLLASPLILTLLVLMPAIGALLVALVSTALCLVAALALAGGIVRGRWPRVLEAAGMLPLAASSLVLGTGLFLILHPIIAPQRLALPVTALVNAALALPFALRLLLPALRDIEAAHGRLADALGLGGLARLRWLVLPRLRPVLGFAAGVVAALSMGDLGVIALFADEGTATLPLLVQRRIVLLTQKQRIGRQ